MPTPRKILRSNNGTEIFSLFLFLVFLLGVVDTHLKWLDSLNLKYAEDAVLKNLFPPVLLRIRASDYVFLKEITA